VIASPGGGGYAAECFYRNLRRQLVTGF